MPGRCKYTYTPAEHYANPGQGDTCGARTYHRQDVKETRQELDENGVLQEVETGRILPREQPDPYCPYHGGTPNPNPGPDDEPPPPSPADQLATVAERADVAHSRAQDAQQSTTQLAGDVSALTARVAELERRAGISPAGGESA